MDPRPVTRPIVGLVTLEDILEVIYKFPKPRSSLLVHLSVPVTVGAPEVRYRRKNICVRGLVRSYLGVPQIIARSPSQIRVTR